MFSTPSIATGALGATGLGLYGAASGPKDQTGGDRLKRGLQGALVGGATGMVGSHIGESLYPLFKKTDMGKVPSIRGAADSAPSSVPPSAAPPRQRLLTASPIEPDMPLMKAPSSEELSEFGFDAAMDPAAINKIFKKRARELHPDALPAGLSDAERKVKLDQYQRLSDIRDRALLFAEKGEIAKVAEYVNDFMLQVFFNELSKHASFHDARRLRR
jgi:hypothetical protein